MMHIDDHVGSAREFIEYFADRHFCTSDIHSSGYFYRGLPSCKYSNLPAAFRSPNCLRDYSPSYVKEASPSDLTVDKLKYHLIFQLHSELSSVHLFTEAADKIGIETSLDYTLLKEAYKSTFSSLVIAETSTQLDDFAKVTFPNERLLEAFGLAQHHGVPTRLLDWTESPFVAAFFAAYAMSDAAKIRVPNQDGRICIYFMAEEHAARLGLEVTLVPRYRNRYLRSQAALFIHMPHANEFFVSNGRWPSIEDLAKSCEGAADFIAGRVTVSSQESNEVLRILYDMGMRRETLMPSLQSAAEAFQYRRALFGEGPIWRGTDKIGL